eukprot:59203_1
MGNTQNKGSTVTACKEVTLFSVCMVSICCISMVILLPLLWIGIRHSMRLKTRKIKILYQLTCIPLFIAGTMLPVHFVFQFPFSGYCDNFQRIVWTASIPLFSYLISLVCVYGLYLIRFITLSNHSPHKSSTFIIRIMQLVLFAEIVLVLLTIWWNITTYHHYFLGDMEGVLYWKHLSYSIYLSFGIVHVLFNLVLLLLFLRKMSHMSRSIRMDATQSDIVRLLEPVSVYTSSFIYVFVSTFSTTLYGSLRGYLYMDTNRIYMVHLALLSIDTLINCFALNVQFEPMQHMLHRKYKKSFNVMCLCCVNLFFGRIVHDMEGEPLKQTIMELREKQYHKQFPSKMSTTTNDTLSTTKSSATCV